MIQKAYKNDHGHLNVLQGIKIILYDVNTIEKSNDGNYYANAVSQ